MPPASGCIWGGPEGGGAGGADVGCVLGVVVVSVGEVSVVGVIGDDAADCVGVVAVVGGIVFGGVGVVAVVGTGVVPVVPPAACVPGAAGGETVAAEAPGCGASDGGAAGLNPGGGVVPTVSPAGGDCPGGPGSTPSGVSVGATGGTGMFLTGGVAASSDAGPAGRTGAPTGAGGGTGASGCACSSDVGPVTGASGGVTGGAGGAGGGGSRLFSVGCGVDGTSVAPLTGGGAMVGACETTGDS